MFIFHIFTSMNIRINNGMCWVHIKLVTENEVNTEKYSSYIAYSIVWKFLKNHWLAHCGPPGYDAEVAECKVEN